MSEKDLNHLKSEIEGKIIELRTQTDKLTTEFQRTILNLAQKGYKIDKDKILGAQLSKSLFYLNSSLSM